MWQFILGSAGFLLYFIYDINSIKKKNTMRNICSYGIFHHASERCIKNKIKIPAQLWISGLSRYMR